MKSRLVPTIKRSTLFPATSLLLALSCSYLALKADSIRFDHALHLEEGAECLTCHADVDKSVELAAHMPPMAVCADCHDDDMDDCADCHTHPDRPKPIRTAATDIIFSHRTHAGEAECRACHTSVAAPTGREGREAPGHEGCAACHSARIDGHRCFDCHRDLGTRKLSDLGRFTHREHYLENHQEDARRRPEDCFRCHDQTHCGDCHNRLEELKPSLKYPESIERHFVHRGDYVTRHVIEARTDRSNCNACHGLTFCSDCHAREGLTRESGSTTNPHPAGWETAHGRRARRDILHCAGCHEQGDRTNCIGCHRVGGIGSRAGARTHPPGWDVSVMDMNDRMCRLCHM